jgi:serine protease AprX
VPAVNANLAQTAGFRGAGIGVAVLDSGIHSISLDVRDSPLADNSCKASRVVVAESFQDTVIYGGADVEKHRLDAFGHGTHVAGIIAANARCDAASLGGYSGVAPEANLISMRVLDHEGKGKDSRVIQAIDRVIALKDQHNIRVMNLSLGRRVVESYTKDPLCQAVERAWKAGIVVVVAAGNLGRTSTITVNGRPVAINGYGTIGSPGNDPFVITVGATRDMFTPTRNDDVMASYSSKGPTAIDKKT